MQSLDKDYPYIRAWGQILGSFDYYISMEQEKAKREKAPRTACYYSDTEKRWVTYAKIHSKDTKARVRKYVNEIERLFI